MRVAQKPALRKAAVFIRNGVVNKAARISRECLIQLEMPRLPIVGPCASGSAISSGETVAMITCARPCV